jgi:hypothetical protein
MINKISIIVVVLTFLISTTNVIIANDSSLNIRLPPGFVTMLTKWGSNSTFEADLFNVPNGYDISNGTYSDWCVQINKEMTVNVNHTVRLYSSYDPNMPPNFRSENWSKINYVLNHKQGNKKSIQTAIWYYINFTSYILNNESLVKSGYILDNDFWAMIADANENGTGFVPHSGQNLAILINGVPDIQRTFIEYIIPKSPQIGQLVWYDSDRDGIQDEQESGIANVIVKLYSDANVLIKSTITDNKGYYSFSNITSGKYYLHFKLLPGYQFSPKNKGSNTFIDSDVNTSTGKTSLFNIPTNISNSHWDAGMYKLSSKGNERINHPPTADATAGEPYTGFTQENITYDGSRSYDRDGRIVNWFWDFGDRTNGTGKIVKHRYTAPGKYTVVLTVTDNEGATDRYTTTSEIMIPNLSLSTPVITGPKTGHKNKLYNYTAVSTNSNVDFVQYIFDWNDDIITTTNPSPSGTPMTIIHSWNTAGHYILKVKSIHNNSESEIATLTVWIDVWDVTTIGYLIDQNSDGTYDVFHNSVTGVETRVQHIDNKTYLIDSDGDNIWNYIFHLNPGELQVYQGVPINIFLAILLLLIIPQIIYFISRARKQQPNEMIIKTDKQKENSIPNDVIPPTQ